MKSSYYDPFGSLVVVVVVVIMIREQTNTGNNSLLAFMLGSRFSTHKVSQALASHIDEGKVLKNNNIN